MTYMAAAHTHWRVTLATAGAAAAAILSIWPFEGRAETLLDAIQMATQGNPDLKAEQSNVKATHEGVTQARGQFGPQVSFSGGLQYQDATVNLPPSLFLDVPTTQHFNAATGSADLSVVQPLFTSGRNRFALEEASDRLSAERQTRREVESRVILNVITAYMDVLRDRETLAAVQSEIGELNGISNELTETARLGALSKTDVAQSQSRLLRARAQLAEVKGALGADSSTYLSLVGQSPGELQPPPDLPGLPDSVDKAFDVAAQNNAELQASLQNEKAARERVNEAKSALGPNISLRFDALAQPYEAYIPNEYQRGISAQVVVSQPIFTSGVNSSKVREAADRDGAARLQTESLRRDIVRRVSQAWDQMTAVGAAQEEARNEIAAQEDAAKGSRLEARAGVRPAIDLLNAEAELTNDRLVLIQDRHDLYIARADVLLLMGLLEARFLVPARADGGANASLRAIEEAAPPQWGEAMAAVGQDPDRGHEPPAVAAPPDDAPVLLDPR